MDALAASVPRSSPFELRDSMVSAGRLLSASRGVLRARIGRVGLGEIVEIAREGGALRASVVGFDEQGVLLQPFGVPRGLRPDATVRVLPLADRAPAHGQVLGRCLDAFGRCLHTGATFTTGGGLVQAAAPPPQLRAPIREQVWTGLRVVDGLLPVGRGQRIGLFAGSGVGKSTLLGQLCGGVACDAVVIGLIGERGREVGEFLELLEALGLRQRATLVIATSDEPPPMRARAAELATALAEGWRSEGKHCLLLVDSLTRYARALRESALAAGETPARRGYPASVFARLPELLERSGAVGAGAVTAIYSVLLEGGDTEEPIADEVRGIVDGHWVLTRELAEQGHFPALDVLASVSRVADRVASSSALADARALRESLALLRQHRDAIELGLYTSGARPALDRAIAVEEALQRFLRQERRELCAPGEVASRLQGLARQVHP